MQFCDALQIRTGVTAIVGSGGKTSLQLRLAQELRMRGSVIVCTTTHIQPPEDVPLLLTENEAEVRMILKTHRCVCAASAAEGGKLTASKLSMRSLESLADYVLVEADGAKGLPLKAHAAHEPVIPPEANQVIAVLGLSGIGKPIGEAVHRSEIFCERLGVQPHTAVSPELAAKHLNLEKLHSCVFLNQAEDEDAMDAANKMAQMLTCPVFAGSIQKGIIVCLR